jgi:hypothetical protein
VISPSQGRYLHRTTQTQNKGRQTSMPLVGFEPAIPVFERAETFHASDCAATVTGLLHDHCHELYISYVQVNLIHFKAYIPSLPN